MPETNRRTFLSAGVAAVALTAIESAPTSAAESTIFDRNAFETRLRMPFRHRQAFASPRIANGAVLGFMLNSLNAYEHGFGEGPGTLHAAAVLYSTSVALALDDAAWERFHLADLTTRMGDHVVAEGANANANPFGPRGKGWTIGALQQRGASFFVCSNAMRDLAQRAATTPDILQTLLLPGMMLVPAGVAAINALQEEHFTLFQSAA
jgi:intracellular sulfur oxidation DsrE/DsrF family protein